MAVSIPRQAAADACSISQKNPRARYMAKPALSLTSEVRRAEAVVLGNDTDVPPHASASINPSARRMSVRHRLARVRDDPTNVVFCYPLMGFRAPVSFPF